MSGTNMNWAQAKRASRVARAATIDRRIYPISRTPPERDIPPRTVDSNISLPRVTIVERYNEDGTERT
jgi:hypothetical protein